MLTRAERSLRAAFRKWNTAANWDWSRWLIPTGSTTVASDTGYMAFPTQYPVKAVYNVKLQPTDIVLRPFNRRLYDRVTEMGNIAGEPYFYDLFSMGTESRIDVLPWPTPVSGYNLEVKVYRRLICPTDATGKLDIPEDYEEGLLAWGSYHFLLNKGDANSGRLQYWKQYAEESLRDAIGCNQAQPDEDVTMIPEWDIGGFTDLESVQQYYKRDY